jgi:hypothetical protein
MHEEQGYYSLIQFAEIPERGEFVNIGIVVFANQYPYVAARFSRRPRRVERAFNVYLGNHFQYLLESLNDRLMSEFANGWNKERIEYFARMMSGKIRLSPLRSVLVKDINLSLDELFARLVGEIPKVQRGPRPSTKLADAFRMKGVEKLLIKPDPVMLAGGVSVEAPFGYQNGAFNLINAMSLAGEPDKVLGRASPFMIEGELLVRETALADQKRLVIVGDDAEQQDGEFLRVVSDQMDRHHVRFYRMQEMDPLVADIRQNFAAHH